MLLKARRPIYLIDMDFEITKREILFSIVIICVMLALGLLISSHIETALNDKYQEYNTAAQIVNDEELFDYGLRTNIGNAFVYGELVAVDPVSISDISGQYSYIYKKEEHYERHSRTVTVTDSDGKTHTEKEYYWTWDFYRDWDWHCKQLSFLNHTFNYNAIPLPDSKYYCTKNKSSRVRFVYYVKDKKYTGTIYTNINYHTINNTQFYKGKDIDSLIKHLESGYQLIIFWVLWIVFIVTVVYIFYYMDNNWLEKNKYEVTFYDNY